MKKPILNLILQTVLLLAFWFSGFYSGYHARPDAPIDQADSMAQPKPVSQAEAPITDLIDAAALKPQPKDLKVGQLWVMYIRDPWEPLIITNEIVDLKSGKVRYREIGMGLLRSRDEITFRFASLCIYDPK